MYSYAFRNYPHPSLCGPFTNATCLPLGPCNVGVSFDLPTCAPDPPSILCSFVGNLNSPPTRMNLIDMPSCYVRHSLNLTGTGSLDDVYKTEMSKSKFCLLPPGNNYETFRVYEALEWGCVGVLLAPVPREFEGMVKEYGGDRWKVEDVFIVCEGFNEVCEARLRGVDWEEMRGRATRFWDGVKVEVKGRLVEAIAPD